jgi:hypothetical protein
VLPSPGLKPERQGLPPGALSGFLLVGAFACLVRMGAWHQYDVVRLSDSGTYLELAEAMVQGRLIEDDGGRTPGYPALLAAAGLDGHRIWLLQSLSGIVVSLVLYLGALHLTRSLRWSVAAGATHSVNIGQLAFEANVASETLATLLVTSAAIALVVSCGARVPRSAFRTFGLLAGCLAGAAALTRPQFVFLPAVVALFLFIAGMRSDPGARFRALLWPLVSLAPGVLAILGWSAFNYVRHDYFTLSTYMGINLTNHSIAFAEASPDRYAPIVEILIRHRDAKIQRTGRYSMAVWEALPELQERTHLSKPALSKELARLSFHLLKHRPLAYLRAVGGAWLDFWLVPNYWRPEKLRSPSVRDFVQRAWIAERWVIRLANAGFLVCTFLAVAGLPRSARRLWDLPLACAAAIILASSVLQAFAEYGENTRYSVTVQPLVLFVGLVLLQRFFSARRNLGPQPALAPL